MNAMGTGRAKRITIAASLALAACLAAPAASAQGKPPAKGKPAAAPPAPTEAPTTKKPVSVQPKDLVWGIDHKKLAAIYDKAIDEDYKERYRKVQPGVEMESLDAEVAEKKAEFRRSRVEFGSVATGWDATPLKPEYTYGNKEALMEITRAGKRRYFFFLNNRLWKIIDEIPIGEKAAWGKTFAEATAKLDKYYEVQGRRLAADPEQNRPVPEVDYRDAANHVRAIEWGEDKIGLAFEDAATVAQLSSLRKATAKSENRVDDSVTGILRPQPKVPEPPKPDDKKPGKR